MNELLLPAGTRLIHIGPPKTGSTAIQNSLFAHRGALLDHGVYNACGPGPRAREAGWAILGGRAPVGRPTPRMSAWDDLVAEMRAAGTLRVVHSNEDYGRAEGEQIKRIVGELGNDQPHVVAVVRRLDRFLPSAWQERVKARESRSYEEWLKVVLSERSHDWQWTNIWHPQRVSGLVERWSAEVGRDRMTLIVADESNRAALPGAFEALLGLPSGLLALDSDRSNRSLSYNEAELLRQVNRLFSENGWSGADYRRYVQSAIVGGLNRRSRPEGHLKGPPTPEWARERISELAAEQALAVEESGVRVVGDPSGLAVTQPVEGDRNVQIDVETAALVAGAVIGRSLKARRRDARKLQRMAVERVEGPGGREVARHSDERSVAETPSKELVRVLARRIRNRRRPT